MTVLAGRYELGDELGAGGMATVVSAHDRVLDRPVAVKLLPPGSDPVTRERFLREARAAARLRHPGVVAVHDTGEDDGRAFIVMELVRGGNLADLLERDGPLAVADALTLTAGVLEVLGEAHAAGMVHRDVKPGNVLLPDEGGVKLADFGLAKAFDEAAPGLTTTGAVVGTPRYLAPELIGGAAPGPAGDVYSVGCLLYALLTGHPPFTATSALAVAYAHRHEPVPPVEAERPDVPDSVRRVLTRALEKDPGDRFPHATAMRAALLAAGGPSPVAGPSPAGGPSPVAGPPPAEGHAPAGVPAPAASPAAARAATKPVRAEQPDAPGPTGRGRGRWWTLALLAAVVPMALVAWALGTLTGADEDNPDGGRPAEQPGDADGPPGDAGPDPGAAAPDPQGEPSEADPGGEAPVDEPPPDGPADVTDTGSVTELIAVLADAPPGTYGEQHDDLLEDLLEIRREEDPGERAEGVSELRTDIDEWVGAGELDPEVGDHASALLDEEEAEP